MIWKDESVNHDLFQIVEQQENILSSLQHPQ